MYLLLDVAKFQNLMLIDDYNKRICYIQQKIR